ncbi:MAG: hypothetical protein NE328_00240 [Lentisphaeraceae bacterium]|nr:hypothetical protein [Lentisphaeraceae bacterium]
MLKTILLIEKDDVLKEFFFRVFYIDGFEVLFFNKEEDIHTLTQDEAENVDLVVIDDCDNPEEFKTNLRKAFDKHKITKAIPTLGVLKKGIDPEPAHKHFDAVMVKDNFNIQLLADLVERLTISG